MIGDYAKIQDGSFGLGSLRLGQSIDLLFKMNGPLEKINGGSIKYELGE
jgi:hypothetical protein